MHACIHSLIHSLSHSLTHSFVLSFIQSLACSRTVTHSLTHSLTGSFIHSSIHPFNPLIHLHSYSLTHSLTQACIHSFTRSLHSIHPIPFLRSSIPSFLHSLIPSFHSIPFHSFMHACLYANAYAYAHAHARPCAFVSACLVATPLATRPVSLNLEHVIVSLPPFREAFLSRSRTSLARKCLFCSLWAAFTAESRKAQVRLPAPSPPRPSCYFSEP